MTTKEWTELNTSQRVTLPRGEEGGGDKSAKKKKHTIGIPGPKGRKNRKIGPCEGPLPRGSGLKDVSRGGLWGLQKSTAALQEMDKETVGEGKRKSFGKQVALKKRNSLESFQVQTRRPGRIGGPSNQ